MRLLCLVLILIACLALVGCSIMPVAFQSSTRLAQYGNDAAQKLVADAKAEVADAQTALAKAKAAKPTSLWPIYLVGAICLAGGAALGYWLGRIALGVLLAIGGAGCIAWAQFLERFPWAMWIPFGLIIAGAAYMVWDYWRSVRDKERAQSVNEVLVSAIEKVEPKKYQEAASGPVKAEIKATASKAVVDTINEIKSTLKPQA